MRLRRLLGAKRGQALTELAFAAPLITGLFALGLEGGLVLDDQISLQHYAYEGAQWAVANRASATQDAIIKHIQAQMCGTDVSNPNPIPSTGSQNSRYCRDSSLHINVSKVAATAMGGSGGNPLIGPFVVDAQAAFCRAWDLKVTPSTTQASPQTVAQNGGSVTFTVSLTGPDGTGLPSGSGSKPVVTLSVSRMPKGLNRGTAYFNPPTITVVGAASTSSTLTIYPGPNTPVGTYDLKFAGYDQCGESGQGARDAWVQVTGGSVVTIAPPNFSVDGLTPVCIPAGGGTMTINGQGFAGATVKVGGATATVTSSSSSQLTVTVPSLPSGATVDVAVTVGGVTFTLSSAVTIGPVSGVGACPSPSAAPNGTAIPCLFAATSPSIVGATEYVIQITWTETLVIPWLTNNLPLTASQKAFCQ